MRNTNISAIRLGIAILSIVFITSCQNETTDMPEESLSIDEKIEALLEQLTLEEKIDMIHASSSFTNGGVERLGIPELVMSDGPHGVRREHGRDWEIDTGVMDKSTYLPVGTALASTWNADLGYAFGEVLGTEAKYRGKDIILGPGLNIIRTPLNGRNFEYLTEDPYLNSVMTVGYVKGVQDQGIAACAKHYVANNIEYEREKSNSVMSERTLREIYLPGFKAAVQEGEVLTVMAAYNKYNGTYCAHSEYLLDTILRDELGFAGAVISDWNAVKSTMGAARAGLDIEMGTDLSMLGRGEPLDYDKFWLGDTLLTLVEEGTVKEEWIDAKVRNILYVIYAINAMGQRTPGAYNTPEHQAVAKTIADEAIVLLKNDDILPFSQDEVKRVAVIGANADRKHAGGGGSSQVKAYYEITALQGLQNRLGEDVEIVYAPGYRIAPDATADPALIEEAVAAARGADAVVYVGGLIHGWSDEWADNAYDAEATDKPHMNLLFGQDELISEILKAQPNTAIVLMGGGPVDMTRWQAQAPAILQAWYPGMEGGNALADILLGNVNPSGKLPMTFPQKLEDSPAHAIGNLDPKSLEVPYDEGVFVGYRYFDTYEVEPAFPFGHGLSYTTFEYSDFTAERVDEGVQIEITITNTGERSGAEVVQFYVHDEEASVERPQKELKAFRKVFLEPGEVTVLGFQFNEEAFKYYSEEEGDWVLEPGTFRILVGSSSRDIREEGTIEW